MCAPGEAIIILVDLTFPILNTTCCDPVSHKTHPRSSQHPVAFFGPVERSTRVGIGISAGCTTDLPTPFIADLGYNGRGRLGSRCPH